MVFTIYGRGGHLGHVTSIMSQIFYAPNFEKVDGAYCFWSVRACVGACVWVCVRASHFLCLLSLLNR